MKEFAHDHPQSLDDQTNRDLDLLILESEIDALQEIPDQTPLVQAKIAQLSGLRNDLQQRKIPARDEELEKKFLEAARGPMVKMMMLLMNIRAFERAAPWN